MGIVCASPLYHHIPRNDTSSREVSHPIAAVRMERRDKFEY